MARNRVNHVKAQAKDLWPVLVPVSGHLGSLRNYQRTTNFLTENGVNQVKAPESAKCYMKNRHWLSSICARIMNRCMEKWSETGK